jgi:hypothetical protein
MSVLSKLPPPSIEIWGKSIFTAGAPGIVIITPDDSGG